MGCAPSAVDVKAPREDISTWSGTVEDLPRSTVEDLPREQLSDFPTFLKPTCGFGDNCPLKQLEAHCGQFSHPHLDATPARPRCKDARCRDYTKNHRLRLAHTGDPDYEPLKPPCTLGESCPLWTLEDHCANFAHPDKDPATPMSNAVPPPPEPLSPKGFKRRSSSALSLISGRGSRVSTPTASRGLSEFSLARQFGGSKGRQACKFGLRCFRISTEHTKQMAHPGDPDYRKGCVVFKDGAQPEFGTLRQLFDFLDPEKHGNFTKKQDVSDAILLLRSCCAKPLDADKAWKDMGGELNGHVCFSNFAAWAAEAGSQLPVGVEYAPPDSQNNHLSCGFKYADGQSCGCLHFVPAEGAGNSGATQICKCGHKRSMHALRTKDGEYQPAASMAPVPAYWRQRLTGQSHGLSDGNLLELSPEVCASFQALLDCTRKIGDNWTRDRGCSLHGTTCRAECAMRHKRKVPTGYKVQAVVRNMNTDLWGLYAVTRASVTQECESSVKGKAFEAKADVKTVGTLLEDSPLVESCNEWFLFHGTKPSNCQTISSGGFKLNMAGTGRTWKGKKGEKGMPLYGYGIYFAESITKADEYSEPVPEGHPFSGCHAVLLCRVTAGRVQVCDTDKIDPNLLQKQVIAGPYHSVLGDRVSKLNKPFREMVVYDATQCYPEYIVYYRRLYS